MDIFSKRMSPLFMPSLSYSDNSCQGKQNNTGEISSPICVNCKKLCFFRKCVSSFSTQINQNDQNVSTVSICTRKGDNTQKCKSSFLQSGYASDVSDNNNSSEVENMCTVTFSDDDDDDKSVSLDHVNDTNIVISTKSNESTDKKTPQCRGRKCIQEKVSVRKCGVKTRSMTKNIDILAFSSDESDSTPVACRTRHQRKKRQYLKYFGLTAQNKHKKV
jgi:hypothetical protein